MSDVFRFCEKEEAVYYDRKRDDESCRIARSFMVFPKQSCFILLSKAKDPICSENVNAIEFPQIGSVKKVTLALLAYADERMSKTLVQLTNKPHKFFNPVDVAISQTLFPQYHPLPYSISHQKNKNNTYQGKINVFEHFFRDGDLFGWTLAPFNMTSSSIGKILSLQDCIIVFTQIAQDLKKLHDHDIAHFDIKEENALLDLSEDGVVAHLTDFGLSRTCKGTELVLRRGYGTLEYTSPERLCIDKDTYIDIKAEDMFALGMTIIAFFEDEWSPGVPPWKQELVVQIIEEEDSYTKQQLYKKCVNMMKEYRSQVNLTASREQDQVKKKLFACVSQLIQVNYKKRLTVDQFLQKMDELKK